MPEVIVRKLASQFEETFHEFGPAPERSYRRAAMLAVIENPYAGRYVADIQPFIDDLRPLGLDTAQRLVAILGGAEQVEGYGKGALIGADGELEHGALWHAPGGYGMREVIGGSKAIVPSAKKVGAVGARLDVPITHINAAYVRSHFDSMEVGLEDAPRAGEMLLALVMSTGPRIHSRSGGLEAWDIIGEDGLR